MQFNDPYLILNSEALVKCAELFNPGAIKALSIDVRDLSYMITHNELMKSVKVYSITEDSDKVGFIQKSGVSVDSFKETLEFYLKSTISKWRSEFYVQKLGVCIGSKVYSCPVHLSFFRAGFCSR